MLMNLLESGRMGEEFGLYNFIVAKIIVSLLINTFYVPDEYWQSLEVAHRQAFGYGYLTWEWNYKIRSYIYPFIISIIYKLLAIIGLDYPGMVIYLPRLCQAVLSGYAEYRFYKWNKNKLASSLMLLNPFWTYCSTRTLANTLEASLTMIALSIFPWKNEDKHGSKFLWLVGLMFFMRPTSAIMWAPLCLYHICICNKSIIQVIKDYLFIGLSTAGIAIAIDSYCYGELVITPWEFFKINVLTNVANHYGKQRTLWYLYTALPVFLSVKIVVLPLAIRQTITERPINSKQFISVAIIAWTITIYSMLPHKEHRFLLPLLPLLIYVIASIEYPPFISQQIKDSILLFIFVINFITIFYIGIIHQQGPIRIMGFLRNEIDTSSTDVDVMFLTPCHSTPFYSHIHRNISMEFLTCEPNLQNQDNYMDEADIFFKDPMVWLRKRYANSTLPKFMVMYDNLAPRIKGFLKNNYNRVFRVFNSNWPSTNRGHYMALFKLE